MPALIGLGLVALGINYFAQSLGMTFWQGVVALCFGAMLTGMLAHNMKLTARKQAYQARRASLLEKYNNDESLVQIILAGQVGQGMTAEMLTDSLGTPVEIDRRVLSSQTEHTYKYGQTGINRFAVRVYLQNDIVTGWNINGATSDLISRPIMPANT